MRCLSALLLLSSTAFAVAEVAGQSWEVRSALEIVRVPESVVLREMANLSNPAFTASTIERLRQNLPPGSFKKMADLMTTAPEGRRGLAEEIEVLQYGVQPRISDPRIWPANPSHPPESVAYPFCGFDSERVGSHLRFTSRVSQDGSSVFLHYDGGSREFERQVRFETGVLKGAKLFVERPQFSNRVSRGTTAIASGQTCLIGSYKLPGANSIWELHFLSATSRRVPAPAPPASLRTNSGTEPEADARGRNDILPKRSLTLEVLKFHVPKNDALAARTQLLDDSHRAQAIEELVARVGQGRAQLVDWQTIQTTGNERAASNRIAETTYPVELGKIRVPPVFGAGVGNNRLAEVLAKTWKRPHSPMDPPSAFETRNAGNLCEVEAALAEDGQTFDLQYNFDSVDHTGFYRWPSGPDATGKVSYAFLPHFNSRKLTSSITLASGKPFLLGFHKLPGDLDRVELTIIRGTIHSLPANP